MIYNNFKGRNISALGMGCMRLPTVDGDISRIDEEKVAEMFDYAISHGVNYFDTAWGYHNGQSEIAVGKALKKYPRESFYLADKFPGYDLANMDKVEEIFEKQLEKTGAEYFDFYLFHNVCEMNVNEYLDEKYRIFDYLMKQKENGRIRHLGFSGHGNSDTLKLFLDKYGYAMEFGMLQLNWLDWTFQKAKEKVELLAKYGLPVWAMEPMRGGKLATLAPQFEAKLKAENTNERIPGWGFRFLQSIPEIKVTLSGMSNFEQLKENIATYEKANPLTESEWNTLQSVAAEMLGNITPCTGCRYCTEYCPQGLNIPELLELYNEHKFSGGGFIAPMRISRLPDDKKPSACLQCRACEAVCPQNIRIADAFVDFTERLQ